MKKRQLEKMREAYTIGPADLRHSALGEADMMLRADSRRIAEMKAHLRAEYRRDYEAWTSSEIEGDSRPMSIQRDVRDGRICFWTAIGMTISDVALALVVARAFGINPILAVIFAAGLPFGIKSALLVLWRDKARPSVTKRRFRLYVIVPSLALLLFAAVVILLSRALTGTAAVSLMGLISSALFAASLGFMGLAAGLFAYAHLLFWSKEAEARYRELEDEEAGTQAELQNIEALKLRTRGMRPDERIAESEPLSDAQSKESGRYPRIYGSAAPLIFFCALLLSGCKTDAPSTPSPTDAAVESSQPAQSDVAASPAQSAPGGELNIYIDWTISVSDDALKTATNSVIDSLPDIIERLEASHLAVYQFTRDGWNAQEIFSVDLPAIEHPRPKQSEETEAAAVFGNVQRSLDEQNRKENEERSQMALGQYRSQVKEKLAGLNAATLLPLRDPGLPPCTDINGVLGRIAFGKTDRRFNLLVTDGHDTCSGSLKPILKTEVPTSLVIILLPEREQSGGARTNYEQFKQRSATISQALPWAVIRPHFANDLAKAIYESLSPKAP